MRTTKRIAIAVLAVSALLAPAPATAATEPGPAWRLRAVALPTNLPPSSGGSTKFGPVYELIATNIGGEEAAGPVTLSATFPDGVTPVFDAVAPLGEDRDKSSPDPVCSKTPSQTVTCTAEGPVYPSRPTMITIPVEVSETSGQLDDVVASVSSPGTETVTTSIPTRIDADPPAFGFLGGSQGLSTLFTEANGTPSVTAGSHPDRFTINLGFPVEQPVAKGPTTNAGHPRDILTNLPRGVVINPNATSEKCTELQLLSGEEINCPPESQVGVVTVTTDTLGPRPEFSAVYNMKAPPGYPAMLAFEVNETGIYVHVGGGVRSESDFGIYAESPDTLARVFSPLEDFQFQLWGDPTSHTHDQVRGDCRKTPSLKPCDVKDAETPLLTLPSACSNRLTTTARARSWEESNEGVDELGHETSADATDLNGHPVGIGDCSSLKFDPTLTVTPDTSAAESPTGVEVDLQVPQSTGFEKATSNVKDVEVAFPPGLVANASAAGGQEACSPGQIGMLTGVGQSPVHLSDDQAGCPDASKLGSLEVTTPVLDHPLPGSVYLAEPYRNPFGTLLAAYLVIDSPQDGLVAKVASKIEADPNTGQLTATLEESPELPFSRVKVSLFGGPRAALRTPATCGTYTTRSAIVPWSGGKTDHESDSFSIDRGANGRSCASSEASMPNSPDFEAGTQTPIAGSYSPFLARLSRDDGEQQLKQVNASLPPGLTGRLAGVVTCSDAAIAVAPTKSGADEIASPSCPAASQIGQVQVGAGAGPDPYYTTGKIYLAGPYKGAPISGVVITPAVAGPFDLGTVVVRAPSYVDLRTAQLSLDSDPFPHILEGIPLGLRDARISLDRGDFTRNPTSCNRMSVDGQALSLAGSAASLFRPFQVGGCRGLEYEPRLFIRLFGQTKRGGHPRLRAVLTAKPDAEANTARASVALPRSEFIENAHFQTICTRVQFADRRCPKGSIYGYARALTPLLDEPVKGPVYLRSSSHELPDMVALLRGPADKPIELELSGRIDSVRGAIRSTFEAVPDAPCKKSDHPRYCQKVVDSITKLKFISRNDSGRAARRAKFVSFDSASISKKPGHKPKKHRKHKKKGGIRISGSMRRGGNPALRAVLTTHQGPDSATPEANIARVSVALPHSAFLDQAHIRTICTRVQFAEGNGHGSNCPAGSIYGHATAITPLLGYALEGNVYLRSSDNPLPDLVPVLEGPAWQPLAIVLDGRIDSKNGGIRTTFDYVPDAPVSKFILDMQGGKKGLIQNSRNLCASTARATVNFTGQNGKVSSIRPVMRPECPKKHKKKHKKRRGHSKPKHKKG